MNEQTLTTDLYVRTSASVINFKKQNSKAWTSVN